MFCTDKEFVEVIFKYDNAKETYKVSKQMTVMATQNMKDCEIYNTMEFVGQDMKEDKFKINDLWFNLREFSENFIPSFCCTVYKFQGCDINEHYNIFYINRMDKKELYTALSRTTKFEYLHADFKKVKPKYG